MLNVARETNDQFNQPVARARTQSKELSGDFIVTSNEHVTGLLIPALKQLQMENPSLHIQYLTSAEVLKLEYGSAHIVLRSGPKPMGPDNVVSAFAGLKFGMFAHDAYIARHGFPTDQNSLHNHKFVCWDIKGMGVPFQDWFEGHVKKPNILFSSSDLSVTEKAVHSGMGLGLIAEIDAPNGNGLHHVWPSPES